MMRRVVAALMVIGLVLCTLAGAEAAEKQPSGTITLSGAWAIYPTAVAWAEEFQKKYPSVKVDVSAGGAGKGAADAIAGLVDIGMVSRDPDPAELGKGVEAVYILHDAVFPVISDKNPVAADLLKRGVKKDSWINLYVSGTLTTWGGLIGTAEAKPIHLYTRSDSCGAAASWAAYLGKKQEDLRGVGVYSDPGILDAARKDPVGIGYSNFSYVFTREGTLVPGAVLVPIDSNENGSADADEVYDTRENAIKAIRAGRYPATRKNYFFVKGKPQGLVKQFIVFALSDEGTTIVDQVATSLPLTKEERDSVLKGLE
jgi:phosphate transport system substrate-binding protein